MTISATKTAKVNHAARKYGIKGVVPRAGGATDTYWWDGYRWDRDEASCFLSTKENQESNLRTLPKSLPEFTEYEVVRLVK